LCLNPADLYSEKLINEGTVTKEEVVAVIDKYEKICEDAYKKAAEETQTFHKHWLDSPWSGFFEGKDPLHVSDTGKSGIHVNAIREKTIPQKSW
jgi:2-oxoglutarate dehydrogenase E1 component